MDTRNSGSSEQRRHLARFFAHLIVIMMLFVLPEVMMTISMPHRRVGSCFPAFYLKTGVYIALFYVNYYFVIGRTLARRDGVRIWAFLGYNLFLLVAGLSLCYVLNRLNWPDAGRHGKGPELSEWQIILKQASFYLRDAVMMILTISLAVALRLSDKWISLERRRQEVVSARKETELQQLKSQLNPHFLFNTLNSIYVLIDISPEDARRAVHELSGMMRYMLYENPESVALRQEVDFVENYISLMKIRLGDNAVKTDISAGDYAEAQVPPLLFVALIENAFKYGNTGNPDEPIEISIKAADGMVTCTTFNHFIPKEDKDGQAQGAGNTGGIGIINLRRRLQLLYNSSASLTTTVLGNTFSTCLQIPLKSND